MRRRWRIQPKLHQLANGFGTHGLVRFGPGVDCRREFLREFDRADGVATGANGMNGVGSACLGHVRRPAPRPVPLEKNYALFHLRRFDADQQGGRKPISAMTRSCSAPCSYYTQNTLERLIVVAGAVYQDISA